MSSLFAIAINAAIAPALKIRPGCFVECLNAHSYQHSFWNTGLLSIDSVMFALVIVPCPKIRLGPMRFAVLVMLPSTSAIRN